jgi:hypothetical protein
MDPSDSVPAPVSNGDDKNTPTVEANGESLAQLDLNDAPEKQLSLSSRAVHADDHISAHRAVAPAMHVSTTFKYSRNPDELTICANLDVSGNLRKGRAYAFNVSCSAIM